MNPNPKEKMYRSQKYLKYVRSFPCISCHKHPAQAHHEPMGQSGTGIKPHDTYTLPLCNTCHTLRNVYGVDTFWDNADMDYKWEIIKLLVKYTKEKDTKIDYKQEIIKLLTGHIRGG